mgnify:CR=1 FL=1
MTSRRLSRKRSKRISADWHKQTRRRLDRHDYWSRFNGLSVVRRSEGRTPRVDSWRARQPFEYRIAWAVQVFSAAPAWNGRIALCPPAATSSGACAGTT